MQRPVVSTKQAKRKNTVQKQKGVQTPEALKTVEKDKTKAHESTAVIKDDEPMNTTPVGKQRRKEDKESEGTEDKGEKAGVDTGDRDQQPAEDQREDKTKPKEEHQDKHDVNITVDPTDPLKAPEPIDIKKCCKCTHGNCLKCKCYTSMKYCLATCTAVACANKEPMVKTEQQGGDEATYLAKIRAAPDELAKDVYNVMKSLKEVTSLEIDCKYILREIKEVRTQLKEIKAERSELQAKVDDLEKKLKKTRRRRP